MLPKILLLLSASFQLWANFTGEWEGDGQFFLGKKKGECHSIQLSYYHDEQSFILRGGGYTCGEIVTEYGYTFFKNKSGKLFIQGKQYGTITENKLTLIAPEHGYKLELEIIDEIMNFKETWYENNQLAFSVSGQLVNIR